MNIKAHIEAGHYERDDKGRALVPHIGGGTAVIATTNGYDLGPIIGWILRDGRLSQGLTGWRGDEGFLLPPPPRRRSGWIVLERRHEGICVKLAKVFETRADAEAIPFCASLHVSVPISYDEEWPA